MADQTPTAVERVTTWLDTYRRNGGRDTLACSYLSAPITAADVAELLAELARLREIEQRARDSVDPLCHCGGCGSCAADYILTGENR